MPKFKQKTKVKANSFFEKFSSKINLIFKKFSFLKWLDPFTYVDLFVMPIVKKHTQSKYAEFFVNLFFAAFFAILFYNFLALAFGFKDFAFPIGKSNPLVIVYSASMQPVFFRGDIIALSFPSNIEANEIVLNKKIENLPLSNYAKINYELPSDYSKIHSYPQIKSITFFDGQELPIQTNGDIIVYTAYPSGLPIIHRVVGKIVALDGNFFITKGDNALTNPTIDQDCGNIVNGKPENNCITFYAIPQKDVQGKFLAKIPLLGCAKLWLVDNMLSLIFTGKLPNDFSGVC